MKPMIFAIFIIFWLTPVAHATAAVAVNDKITLRATNPAGVPVHKVPRGTNDFRRVPDKSKAIVLELIKNGRWLRLQFDDNTTGWITNKYVAAEKDRPNGQLDGAASGSGDIEAVWKSPESCKQTISQGKRMPKSTADALRIATWNIRWFPRGCSPSQSCEENTTDIDWLACTIAWMNIDVLAVQEILDSVPARVQLATLTDELNALTGGSWENDLHDCGPPKSQHVGFLWNSKRVTLENPSDLAQMNGASRGRNACASNLRPGRYAHVKSKKPNGADFHLISVHFDSGVSDRDFQNRRRASSRIPLIRVDGTPITELDRDVIVAGDFNTMGRKDAPAVFAADEIGMFDREIGPGFKRLPVAPFCTEYYKKKPGTLDHFVVSEEMREASVEARVSGYCAVSLCKPIRGAMPSAYEKLSDHCPVLVDVRDEDLD